MKELAVVYAVAEFFPILQTRLKERELKNNAGKIYEGLRDITGVESAAEMLVALKKDAEKMMQFQNNIFEIILKTEQNYGKMQDTHSTMWQRMTMVILLALSLLGCLFIMIFSGEKLSGEGISIVSSVAGVFGVCLKDAFSGVFNAQTNKNNNKTIEK